jgi:adenylosuccinate lyase
MALWHERDISHSSAERFVFERALGVAAYATRSMATLLSGVEVDAERMARNLDLLGGMVHSEALLLAMIAKGADRQEAYRLVQAAAKRAWSGASTFRAELSADAEIGRWLSAEEVQLAMTMQPHLDGIEATYRAMGLVAAERSGG